MKTIPCASCDGSLSEAFHAIFGFNICADCRVRLDAEKAPPLTDEELRDVASSGDGFLQRHRAVHEICVLRAEVRALREALLEVQFEERETGCLTSHCRDVVDRALARKDPTL